MGTACPTVTGGELGKSRSGTRRAGLSSALNTQMPFKLPLGKSHREGTGCPQFQGPCKLGLSPPGRTRHPALEKSQLSQLRPPCPSQALKGRSQGSHCQQRLKGPTLRCLPHLLMTGRVTQARPSTSASTGTAGSVHQAGGHSTSFRAFCSTCYLCPAYNTILTLRRFSGY